MVFPLIIKDEVCFKNKKIFYPMIEIRNISVKKIKILLNSRVGIRKVL